MAESRESSGLLSLASLREHEKRHDAARARAEAEQRARVEVEREFTRAEHERLRAERAALELAESARRADAARFEAARRAESEHALSLARDTEELRLNLSVEREARRNVELNLTAKLLRQRLLTSCSVALCLGTWAAAAALYFGALRPSAERTLAAAQQALSSEQRARGEAQANGVRLSRHSDELTARVAGLEQALRDERAAKAAPPAPQAGPHRPGSRPLIYVTPPKPCRDDGDPLNPCLKH